MNSNELDKNICIVGLGYVGLPLYIEFSKKYSVIGYDKNPNRISDLKNRKDSNNEFNKELTSLHLNFTDNIQNTKSCNVFIVTVPTPVNKNKSPNLNFLKSAFNEIGHILKKKDMVILESTVYPGCSEEICIPIIENISKLKLNIDFYFGFSPERINPGDKKHILRTIKKVTSGSNEYSAKIIDSLYRSIIEAGTHLVSSLKVAEASKILENTQRDLNISLMNEFAFICDKLGIRTNEVIDAALTKWNFQEFRPGLVGGHCIGVDPYYLTHKSLQLGYKPEIILSGRKVNENVPEFIITKVVKKLIEQGNIISQSNVIILGASFKENCGDFRNSKVQDMYNSFLEYSINTEIYDPLINSDLYYKTHGVKLIEDLKLYDAIIIAVPHENILKLNMELLKKKNNSIIFDVKGAFDKNEYFQL